jgi:hypothetical protein
MVRQRQENEAAKLEAETKALYEYRTDKAIDFYFKAERYFLDFIRANEYPGAAIREVAGREYLSYNLYDLDTSHSEGERYFSEDIAIYLLINEHG